MGALPCRLRVDRCHERSELGKPCALPLHHRNFNRETLHHVGAGPVLTDKMTLGAQDLFQVTEVCSQLFGDAGRQRRRSIAKPCRVELQQDRRHGRAFGIMHKFEMAQRASSVPAIGSHPPLP